MAKKKVSKKKTSKKKVTGSKRSGKSRVAKEKATTRGGFGETQSRSNKTNKRFYNYIQTLFNSDGADSLDSTSYKEQLKKHHSDGDLVLVVGAGVSLDQGLPDWNTLLQRLLLTTIKNDDSSSEAKKAALLAKVFTSVFSPDPLIAARYLSLHYRKEGKSDSLVFYNAIKDALYENKD